MTVPAAAAAPLGAYAPASAAPPARAAAVVFDAPGELSLRELALAEPGPADVVVDVEWSGVSAGTERLLWRGTMPTFPGMGYPLVPGYETVGRVRWAGPESGRAAGERVFLPGAHGFRDARNLFGGAARTLVAPGARAHRVGDVLGEEAVLLALAATALHAVRGAGDRGPGTGGAHPTPDPRSPLPDLIVGHGALGRLAARLVLALGGPPPTVWEVAPERAGGARGYAVLRPEDDPRRDYRCACEASGDAAVVDALIGRLAPGGEVVLAGFYTRPIAFAFVPAFMRGARLRVASEWRPDDLAAARALAVSGRLPLDGLVTHRARAGDGEGAVRAAYRAAFDDADCVKMVLDWRSHP
jgi:3-hydroxyethyl bacteriochlorophyllide a dehydrogenase